MARIFAYIVHKAGVADDSAAELAAAARAIDAARSTDRHCTGSGPDLEAVCEGLASSFAEVWKISNEALAYPNAELVRKALVKVLPPGSILLVAHDHFGIDLAPGLSIKTECSVCFRCAGHRRRGRLRSQTGAPGIRRAGQRSRSVRYFVGRSDQHPPGRFQSRGGRCRQREWSSTSRREVGALTAGAAIWKRSSPKLAMWTSPSTTSWSRSAAAFRRRTMSASRRSSPTPWAPR